MSKNTFRKNVQQNFKGHTNMQITIRQIYDSKSFDFLHWYSEINSEI